MTEIEELKAELADLRRDLDAGVYYVQHGKNHRKGGRDPHGIIVEESDGSPSAKNVTKLIVSPNSLTDNLDGSATLTTGSGAGGTSFVAPAYTFGASADVSAGVSPSAVRADAVVQAFDNTIPVATAAVGSTGSLPWMARSNHQHQLGAHGHTVAAGDGGVTTHAQASEAYVTIGNSANLSAERALTAGAGQTLTDGLANGLVTMATPYRIFTEMGSAPVNGVAI